MTDFDVQIERFALFEGKVAPDPRLRLATADEVKELASIVNLRELLARFFPTRALLFNIDGGLVVDIDGRPVDQSARLNLMTLVTGKRFPDRWIPAE